MGKLTLTSSSVTGGDGWYANIKDGWYVDVVPFFLGEGVGAIKTIRNSE